MKPSETPVFSRHSLAAGRNQSSKSFGGHFKREQFMFYFWIIKIDRSENTIDTFSSRRTSTDCTLANVQTTVNANTILYILLQSIISFTANHIKCGPFYTVPCLLKSKVKLFANQQFIYSPWGTKNYEKKMLVSMILTINFEIKSIKNKIPFVFVFGVQFISCWKVFELVHILNVQILNTYHNKTTTGE